MHACMAAQFLAVMLARANASADEHSCAIPNALVLIVNDVRAKQREQRVIGRSCYYVNSM